MSAKVDVYLPLFVGDYLSDTTDLTAEEHGVYLLLLMDLWKRGGRLPSDPVRLARVARLDFARWENVWSTVSRFFQVEEGAEGRCLIQGRLTRELDKAKARKSAACANGRSGGLAKAKQTASKPLANDLANTPSKNVADSTSSSPSSSFLKTEKAERVGRALKAPKAKSPQNPRVGLFMGWFRSRWETKYATGWKPEPGVASSVKTFVIGLGEDDFAGLEADLTSFFADADRFLAGRCHSLRDFLAHANKYRVAGVNPPVAQQSKYKTLG